MQRKSQDIAFSLVISLVMIMRQVCIEGATQRRFSEQKQPRETLLLDRSHPALRVGVGSQHIVDIASVETDH